MLKGKYKIIAKRMWNRETVVACSKTVQESIQKISLNKPVLIYNPITTLDNAFRTSERRQNHESPTLVAVGRLSPEKNYLFLIEALEILPVAFKLEIYGFGRDPKLEDVILSKKLQNRISLKGHVLHSDLMRKYSGFSCFVMTSDYEGMPSVVIEAASCGIPVVGRKSPGLLEAIELVGGFTPDSDDPLSFARAVETAVLSGKNKRDFSEIKHLFNLDVTGHEYCRLFSD
jgi:glycosyltransferase involved in cell wall biosynthesis